MKKISISVAALLLAGTAFAQSSVTLFGVVDTSVSHYANTSTFYSRTPSTAAVAPPDVTLSQTVLSSGNYVPSRIGVRGTEDLGGGWAASFWLESPLATDSSTVPLIFSRRSTVSFSNSLGEIRLGRDFTPTFWVDTLYDPLLNAGVGANLIASVNGRLAVGAAMSGGGLIGDLTAGPDNYVHTSNSIGYFLPRDLGGFYGQLMHAFPEGIKSTLVPDSPSRRGGLDAGRFGYANDRLDISASYEVSTPVDAVAPFVTPVRDRQTKTANLGASYNFGAFKINGEISHVVDDMTVALPAVASGISTSSRTKGSYDGGLIGFSVPFGASRVRAAYSYVRYNDGNQSPLVASRDASASKLALGYVYSLSKRTLLYATAAYVRIKDGQNNPDVMGVPVSSTGTFVTSGTVSGYAPRSSTGYDFGINHSF